MLIDYALLIMAFFVLGLYTAHKIERWFKWTRNHYLYRIVCKTHQCTVEETTYRPNKLAFGCPFCGWEHKESLQVEKRAINVWSEWEKVK